MGRLALAAAVGLAALSGAGDAGARPRIVDAGAAGPAQLDRVLDLTVRAHHGGGLRVSFPDLQGGFAESACRLDPPAAATARTKPAAFAVPYRPGFAGSHLLEVAVTGGCGAGTSRAHLPLEVGDQPIEAPPAGASTADCPGADRGPAPRDMRRLRRAVLCLLNDARRAAGVAPLLPAEPLRRAASAHVHVLRRGAPFGHEAPGVGGLAARLRAAGVDPRGAGESLAAATGAVASPRSIVSAWLGSDPLRDNALDPAFTHAGVAVLGSVSNVMNHPGATVSVVFAPRTGVSTR